MSVGLEMVEERQEIVGREISALRHPVSRHTA